MPKFVASTSLTQSAGVFSHVPLDWIIIGAFALIVIFDAMRASSTRAITLSLSLPLAAFLFGILPQTTYVGPMVLHSTATTQSVVFILLFGALFFFISRMTAWYGPSGGIVGALLSAFGATVVAIVIWLQEPALQNFWHFSPQIQSLFGTTYALLWLLAAYLALSFSRGK